MRPSTENPACRTLLLLVCASCIPSHTRVLRMPPEEDEGEGCSTGSVLYCTGPEPHGGSERAPTPTYGAWNRKTLQSAVFSLRTLDFLL